MQKKTNSTEIKQSKIETITQLQYDQKDKSKIKYLLKIKRYNKESKQINFSSKDINSKQLACFLSFSNFINTNIIQQLYLDKNKINDEGINYLTYQLIKWNYLAVLKLQNNNISIKGIQYLSKAAQKKRFPSLRVLHLTKNEIGSAFEHQILKQKLQKSEGLILKFANKNTQLRTLYLSENNINDYDMKILFRTNKKNIYLIIQDNYSYITIKQKIKESKHQQTKKFNMFC